MCCVRCIDFKCTLVLHRRQLCAVIKLELNFATKKPIPKTKIEIDVNQPTNSNSSIMSISRVNSNFLCSSNVRLLLGTRFSSSAKSPSESQIARPPRQSVAYSTGTFLNDTLIAPTQRYDWKQIVRDAEKTVDYPTSFANLRWLLSDKVANVGLQLRKLAASSNLLHRTAR